MSDDETLPDQSNVEQAKSTRKRKSAVFQISRRLEALDVAKDDDDDDEKEEDKNDDNNDGESVELRAYIERLKKERKDWKELLSERKARRRNLQKEKLNIEKKGASYDVSLLSESERAFLSARPPYEEICKNINIMCDGAVKVGVLRKEIETFSERLIVKVEKKIDAATSQIIDTASQVT